MGRSKSSLLVTSCALLWASGVLAQSAAPKPVVRDATLRPIAPRHAEMVLASYDGNLHMGEFGLGKGGIAVERGQLDWIDEGCVTAGGVRVECRSVGVKLTFAGGRELLVAPDGAVHLRSGEVAGPFPGGVELLLADGQSVRVALAAHSQQRLRDVVVGDAERRLQPWRRGEAAWFVARDSGWAGVRLACLGDGGDLYRVVALGPLLVLDRVLVAADRAEASPAQRLVVLATPLVQSLRVMERQHREPDAAVRKAMQVIAAVADRADLLFAVGSELARAERDSLRWLLKGGFELQLDLEGSMAPRLQLFAGQSPVPMVEWTLRIDSAAFLANPREGEPERRWHGNGTRLPKVVPELQANVERFERRWALQVIERLKR